MSPLIKPHLSHRQMKLALKVHQPGKGARLLADQSPESVDASAIRDQTQALEWRQAVTDEISSGVVFRNNYCNRVQDKYSTG